MTALSEFIKRVESTRKNLNNEVSRQLHSEKTRNTIRKIVEDYFKTIRPGIISDKQINPDIGKVDEYMQALLSLCHKKGSTNSYKKHLSDIRKNLIAVDSEIISSPKADNTPSPKSHNSIDQQIVDTLESILPNAASSYKQALTDLLSEKRFSWRGPATDFREALRETLDYLAPDKDVESMPGYKQGKDTFGPTMKQKVRYILSKRGISKTQSETTENATESIELSVGTFIRSVYTRSSISTHTSTDKNEVIRIRNFVRATFCELLEIRN